MTFFALISQAGGDSSMSLQLSAAPCHHNKKLHYRKPSSFRVSASLDLGVKSFTAAKSASLMFEAARERIVKLIHKPEVSVSTYDTAWVAMVASPHSSVEPCFPDCVSWLAENQCPDGSWSRSHHHSLLQKDVISSTMACVLALKKWGVGEDQINRGVRFIEMNFASTNEKKQISPIGFDIIFPSMLDYARDLSLNLNLEPTAMNALFHKRNLELKRCYETKSGEMEAYMAYISEGMGKLHDWNSVMKYQRRNGSLFNSPSTTAAACIFHHNERCIDFLRTALKKFGNAVPALYPQSLYNQLCTVHNLEKLGISQYFRIEIQSVLDEAYRWWLQDEEETITDASMCALAFKILRNNGYDLNSDQMTRALEGDFLGGGMTGISRTLELYQASEIIFPFETALEKQNLRLKHSLELELSDPIHSNKLDRDIIEEVKHALEYPFYAITPRMVERRNIEKYKPENIRMLKTSVCSPNFGNSDFHYLSVMDFNRCQQVHLEELKELERWVLDNRLDELKFARQKSAYAFFSAASTFFSPDLSEARMAWAKSCVLTTILDDFFDFGGSLEELKNLVQLVELWDVNASTECISHNVATLFSAVKTIICDIGDKASIQQERSVTKHIVNIWIEMFNSMLREATWTSDSSKPTMEEYLTCADISFALGPIVLPTLYLVGPKISEEMVQHPEYSYLFNLMSISGRLVNDIQTYEREMKQSKLNAVPLYMINCGGDVTEEAAIVEIKRMIERKRRELHKLVIAKNTVLPRACKELFWHMSTIVHLFYIKDDGYSSEDFIHVAKNFIYEPIVVPDQL